MRIGIVLGALFLAACTAMESSEGFVPPSTPVAVPKPASEIEAPQAEAVDEVEDAEEGRRGARGRSAGGRGGGADR
jgi:hypothetical protein